MSIKLHKLSNSKKTLKRKIKITKNTKTKVIQTFLEMLNCTKLYHWSTYSFSQHKATDDLYNDLNKYIDEFVEIMLGKDKERIYSINMNSSYKIYNKKQFINKLNNFKFFLINLNNYIDPLFDTNLINIRDELLGLLDKLLYLFELK